jgi:hypothetical protein
MDKRTPLRNKIVHTEKIEALKSLTSPYQSLTLNQDTRIK